MSNLSFGWCTFCDSWEDSKTKGLIFKKPTGDCGRCGTRLATRKVIETKRKEEYTSSIFEHTTNFYDIPLSTGDTVNNHPFHGNGGSFGGGGASSSWDSSDSSSSYDSGSSSDSGSSGGGD